MVDQQLQMAVKNPSFLNQTIRQLVKEKRKVVHAENLS
jgi:hypothetical protein